MALLTILEYPDPRLRKVATPVTHVTAEIQKLVGDMAETMYAAPGIGLAATQVDVHKRVIVIDISDARDELRVFINPEIVAAEGEAECEEGCLSVPGYYDRVTRAARITVRALDAQGKRFELEAEGPLAGLHPARNGSSDRQGFRRSPVAPEARAAAARNCARSSGSRADCAPEAHFVRQSRIPLRGTSLRLSCGLRPCVRLPKGARPPLARARREA